MSYINENGGNGPRAGRTTGRQRMTLANLQSKQTYTALPDPGFIASYSSQLAALAQQYRTRLASLQQDKSLARSTYTQQLAQITGQEVGAAVSAEGQAVERGVLGGSADVKNRIAVKSQAELQQQEAAMRKQAALASIAESGMTASNQYMSALAALQAERAAATAGAQTTALYNGTIDTNKKMQGEDNAQVWMNHHRDELQPYYAVAAQYKPSDASAWRRLAKKMAYQFYGWGAEEFAAIDSIVMRESEWDPTDRNPTSTAHGIGQALLSHWGENWQNDPDAQRYMQDPIYQIAWMFKYIVDKYGTPQAALAYKDANGNY